MTKQALKELVQGVFDDRALGIAAPVGATEPLTANPTVDPTTASTDPGSPGWVPKDRAEFAVAVGRLIDGLPDEEMPGLYRQVSAAAAAIGKTEDSSMKAQPGTAHTKARFGQQMEGASKSKPSLNERDGAPCPWGKCNGTIMGGKCDRCGTKDPYPKRDESKIEEAIRRTIRRMISEAQPGRDLGYSGPDTYALGGHDDESWKVYRTVKGKRKRQPEASYDTEEEAEAWAKKLRRQFPDDKFDVVDEAPEASEPEREKGEWSVPKGENGLDFSQIAKSMGMSVMGAQALAARAMKRFGHMMRMMNGTPDEEGDFSDPKGDAQPEQAQIMILTAVKEFLNDLNDDRKSQKIIDALTGRDMKTLLPDSLDSYVEFLTSSGELAPADVQLLKDHPGVAETLEGYPEYVRTEMLGDLQAEFADLANDIEKLTGLEAFREYLGKYIKRSIRDAGGDED